MSVQIEELNNIILDKEKWAMSADFMSQLELMLDRLSKLSTGAEFQPIDAELSFEQRSNRLMSWLKTNPTFSVSPKIKIVENVGVEGAGVVAIEEIKADEELFSLPFDSMLSQLTAQFARDIGPVVMQPGRFSNLVENPTTLMIFFLICEYLKCREVNLSAPEAETVHPIPKDYLFSESELQKLFASIEKTYQSVDQRMFNGLPLIRPKFEAKKSPWGSPYRAYISVLPERVKNVLFWSIEEIKSLPTLYLRYKAASFLRTQARYFYLIRSHVTGALDSFPTISWSVFRWASAIVASRQNEFPLRGRGVEIIALAPLYDMFNSKVGPISSFFHPDSRALSLMCDEAVPAGQQVRMSYGARPNADLLMFQGFVQEDNDKVNMTVEFLPSFWEECNNDDLAPIRVRLLSRLGFSVARFNATVEPSTEAADEISKFKNSSLFMNILLDYDDEEEEEECSGHGHSHGGHGHSHGAHSHKKAVNSEDSTPAANLMIDIPLEFCRVMAISKDDATMALKKVHAYAEEASKIRKAQKKGHGHSHGGQACHGHGDEGSDEPDDPTQPVDIPYPVFSQSNEKRALALLASALSAQLERVRSVEDSQLSAINDYKKVYCKDLEKVLELIQNSTVNAH